MSGTIGASPVDAVADFGTDKRGQAERWIAEIRGAETESAVWWKRCEKIVKRYMDDHAERDDIEDRSVRFNILWSNVQTLMPAIYATPPKPVVQRRYLDRDDVGRTAATILQRAIGTNIEFSDFHDVARRCVLDYLLAGRGTCWARYEPHFRKTGAGDGEQVSDSGEGYEELAYEEICWDYVHWRDFCHSPARVWEEVRWVARRVMMTQAEGVARFGAKFREVPLDYRPQDEADTAARHDILRHAEVWEVWDRERRHVVWIAPSYGDAPLDDRPDFLGLDGFFPCPKPLYATLSNQSLIPAPDYAEYRDQANMLDSLSNRIDKITRAIKVAGVYDGANDGVQRVFDEGVENQLIPIAQWGAFSERGGFRGSVDFVPIEPMAKVLAQLIEVRDATKRDVYEITGISDIIRGQGAATATATAERLKGQFATLRLRDRVQAVAVFVRGMVRITGELIAEHFSPETLLAMSDYAQTTTPDPQLAMQAIALLKNDQARGFRIDIEVDSTIVPDQQQEQQARVAFLQMAGGFLQQAMPAVQQAPEMAPVLGQMLLFGIRGFPVGSDLEATFEAALAEMEKASQQPRQPPPPDPKAQAAMIQAQNDQARVQIEAQAEQGKQQVAQAEVQLKAAQLDLANRQHDLDAQRFDWERLHGTASIALDNRAQGLSEQQAAVEAAQREVEQRQAAMQMLMDQQAADADREQAA
jgi:hypothetical protein